MRIWLKYTGIVLMLGLFAACYKATVDQPRTIDDFFKEFTDEWVRRNPNQAVFTQYFVGEEQDRLSRQLTPVTEAWKRERIRLARTGLNELASFDREMMTATQRTSADVMQWQLESIVDSEPFIDYDFPLQQMNGVNVSLPSQLTVVHPVNSERDAENYVARMTQVDDRMAEAIAESKRLAARGTLPPRFILEATITQMQQFVTPPPMENPLVTTLGNKMATIPGISSEQQKALSLEAAQIVEDEIYPTWREAITLLESQLTESSDDAGLWRFENGADLYAERLHFHTSTDLSAEEIHQIGLREVSRIEAEMDNLLRKLGYSDGTINERTTQLRADLSYPDTDEGRSSFMNDINSILADALARTAEQFDVRPESPVIAQPYPEFLWASRAASYTTPPLDGSRPGIFQIPLRPDYLTEFGKRTLVYHETVPGHHFQLALNIENNDLPIFRRIIALGGMTSNLEGWALYAEQLAVEEGWYENDLKGHIGQLNSALFRAKRLVVDTGLHAMGWTRQQAIDYGISVSEVERYVVYPGQACSYMIGLLKMVELREKTKEALGDSFSIKEFHNIVLSVGVVPLMILEEEIDAYIAEAKAE